MMQCDSSSDEDPRREFTNKQFFNRVNMFPHKSTRKIDSCINNTNEELKQKKYIVKLNLSGAMKKNVPHQFQDAVPAMTKVNATTQKEKTRHLTFSDSSHNNIHKTLTKPTTVTKSSSNVNTVPPKRPSSDHSSNDEWHKIADTSSDEEPGKDLASKPLLNTESGDNQKQTSPNRTSDSKNQNYASLTKQNSHRRSPLMDEVLGNSTDSSDCDTVENHDIHTKEEEEIDADESKCPDLRFSQSSKSELGLKFPTKSMKKLEEVLKLHVQVKNTPQKRKQSDLQGHTQHDGLLVNNSDKDSKDLQPKKKKFNTSMKKDDKMELDGFQCNLCDFQTLQRYALVQHLVDQHADDQQFKCKIGTQKPKSDIMMQCDLCQFTTIKRKYLFRHYNKAHPDTQYECRTCGEAFERVAEFIRHSSKHEKKECDVCGEKFDTVTLKAHAKIHLNKKVQCDICHKEFKSKHSLNAHEKLHARGETRETVIAPPMEHDECEMPPTKEQNDQHVNATRKKKLDCEICRKWRMMERKFNAHVKSHLETHLSK